MDETQGRGARADAAVAGIAARQHTVFARWQAKQAGLTARMIGQRLERRRLCSPLPGVYRSTMVAETWESLVMAGCLAGPGVGSHRAAARLWHVPNFDHARGEVTTYRHRRLQTPRLIIHESRFLEEGRDTTFIDGIPVTTPTRTLVDLSSVASIEEMEIALDYFAHRGLSDASSVRRDLDRLQRPRGTERIEAVLRMKIADGAPPESPLESRAAMVMRDAGLPVPVAQLEIRDDAGLIGRVDFAWPDQMVVLEVDGFSAHGYRAASERDQRRQNRLVASGWRVLRVSHGGLVDPARIITDLRRSLGVR